jgi:putative protein-disulfide isomerase
VVGGLRTGSGAALEPTTRRYILEHWQAVTEATGQPFKRRRVARRFCLRHRAGLPRHRHRAQPGAGLRVDAARPDPAGVLCEGRDVTHASVLVELAEQAGVPRIEFAAEFDRADSTPPRLPISPGCRTWALPVSRPCWPSAMANWRC